MQDFKTSEADEDECMSSGREAGVKIVERSRARQLKRKGERKGRGGIR